MISRKVNVCVIGGGISGLTTAYLLSNKGYSVTLLEKTS
ncbi:MAG: FAD-dependent oxidoreductase, partial [Calditrichota bacterium]